MKTPKIFYILFAALALFLYPACRGEQGEPGDAHLSLIWEIVPPNNVSHGNPSLPGFFQYGKSYLTQPGSFTLYYDGTVWNGSYYVPYAWSITYDIHVNEGRQGKWFGAQGDQGKDSYLTLVLSPTGPYEKRTDKQRVLPEGMTLVFEDESTVEILVQAPGHTMHATYRCTHPRKIGAQPCNIAQIAN